MNDDQSWITPEDFDDLSDFLYNHDTEGPFRGYDCLGYIGHWFRNYVTDEWVRIGANTLGWSLAELSEWACSSYGRWAIETGPLNASEMRLAMATADIDALMMEGAEG